MIEPWVLTVATKGGEYLFKTFSSKMGDTIEKKFELQLKGAIKEAIVEFIELFVQELRDSGITENIDPDYRSFLQPFIQPFIKDKDTPSILDYKSLIQSFIKDEDALLILGEAFDADFEGFDNNAQTKIKEIWSKHLLKSRLTFPADFKWQSLLEAYQKKVTKIRQDNPKLRDIFNSQKLVEIAGTLKEMNARSETSIEFDLDGYRQSLQQSYGDLKLGRLGKKDEHNIQLGKIFIEQNVREALPPDPSPNPNSDESERNRRQYLEKSAEPVVTVLRDENCQRAVLLGNPGSGKSSLLQYLALDWVEDNTKPFPLLIELREYAIDRADAKNFLGFLSSRGTMADWRFDRHQLHQYLQTQPSLVMFDGLDEIFDPQLRKSIIDEIANFATQQYPNAKIVITSRVVGYVPDRLRSVDFQHFTLQELYKSQIHEFIDKWYELALGQDPQQDRLKQQLKDEIDRSPSIRILANNPLLLTLMATLNQQASLPTRRVDLYDRALQLLLHNWDINVKELEEDRSLEDIEVHEKQEILGKIAYDMQSKQGMAGNLLDSRRLKEILTGYLKEHDFPDCQKTAKRLIEQLRTRSFILCAHGADAYGFIHRTFLEYFCAFDFVRRLKEEPYSLEQLRDDVFDRYWRDETWHEVLKLICGLLAPEQAGYLVDFLIMQEVDREDYLDREKRATTGAFQHLQLATECWAEVKSPKPRSTAQKLKEKLKEEIESQSKISLGSDAAKLLLHSIAQSDRTEPGTLTWLQNVALNDQNEDVRWIALYSIVQYYHTRPESLNCLQNLTLNSQDKDLRWLAVHSIAQCYHSTPESLNCLQNVALNSQHEDVRWAAVNSIVQYYHSTPESLNCLQNVTLNSQHEDVRRQAVNSIGQNYHSIPESLNCLQTLALNSQHEDVREAAVNSIGEYYHSTPESLNCLQQVALNSQHEDVREAAVNSIGEYYHSTPESLNCLQQVVLNSQHEDVRWQAVYSIAQYYHSTPESLNCLQQVALNSHHEDVRWTAVNSIGEYYHSTPESLNCLQQVALNSQHEDVRWQAVYSIGQYYHSIPETLNCLQQVALNGEHEDIRRQAVYSIGQYYHTTPESLNWLQNVALNGEHEDIRQAAAYSIDQHYHSVPESLNCLQTVALNSQHEDVRQAAVYSISQYYHSTPESLNCLQQVALNSQHENVRWAAVDSISQYYHSIPESLNWLQNVALNNPHRDVRQAAVRSIAYHTEPKILNWLQNVALNDQHEDIRQAAVWSIAQYYHSTPESLNCLENVALNDQEQWVRQAAVWSIAQYYHSTPESLNCLENVALNDQDEWVRRQAVWSIAQYYIQDDSAFKLLYQIAGQDPYRGEHDGNPRKIALEALVKNYINRPEVIELLRDRSTQDPDEELRIWAEEQLKNIA